MAICTIGAFVEIQGDYMKVASGISLDEDVYEVFVEHPHLKRSAWMNYAIRKVMIEEGILKAKA
jgi:hypothetical protein